LNLHFQQKEISSCAQEPLTVELLTVELLAVLRKLVEILNGLQGGYRASYFLKRLLTPNHFSEGLQIGYRLFKSYPENLSAP
jgi:hypothetical protein